MKVIVHAEEELELTNFHEPGMEVEHRDPDAQYSALQMFATSLAICTYSVLAGYGEQIGAATDDISMKVNWEYTEAPRRIGAIDMDIRWPALPDDRLTAAQRAAAQCPIHATLAHSPRVNTDVRH